MKSFYLSAVVQEATSRIASLTPASQRQWGKMTVAQAMDHCSRSLEWAVGDRVPERMFLASLLGRMIKSKVIGKDAPLRKNTPTAKSLIIENEPGLEEEKLRLSGLIERFYAAGPSGCTKKPHSFFGPMTPQEWAILMYKHVDHHLRQFGA